MDPTKWVWKECRAFRWRRSDCLELRALLHCWIQWRARRDEFHSFRTMVLMDNQTILAVVAKGGIPPKLYRVWCAAWHRHTALWTCTCWWPGLIQQTMLPLVVLMVIDRSVSSSGKDKHQHFNRLILRLVYMQHRRTLRLCGVMDLDKPTPHTCWQPYHLCCPVSSIAWIFLGGWSELGVKITRPCCCCSIRPCGGFVLCRVFLGLVNVDWQLVLW